MNRIAVKNMGAGLIERHGDRPGREMDQPAFTIRASAGGTEPGGFVWLEDGVRMKLTIEEIAILMTYPSHRNERINMTNHSNRKVLDLFAGTGVGVAIKNLGATEYGVEIMPEAVATRAANGMETVYNDVWDAHLAEALDFDTLWASPPCQTFSMAGKGAGRKALDDVLGIIHRKQYLDMDELREQSALLGDERIGLVLSPLHYAARFLPTHLAFEQVPPVLPVWEAMAVELRALGYSVWTGLLHAEQFGVPQTRKRAILMARRDGVEVTPPVPTHSKYYSRDPKKLDAGVQKWVSMAEALGAGLAHLKLQKQPNASIRDSTQPAQTMAFGHDASSAQWFATQTEAEAHRPFKEVATVEPLRITQHEAATLQSYPADMVWEGAKTKQYLQIGNAVPPLLAQVILESVWAPAIEAEVIPFPQRFGMDGQVAA